MLRLSVLGGASCPKLFPFFLGGRVRQVPVLKQHSVRVDISGDTGESPKFCAVLGPFLGILQNGKIQNITAAFWGGFGKQPPFISFIPVKF